MRWLLVALPVLLLAAPFALRPSPAPPHEAQVTIMTSHGEAIRSEFAAAFAVWARRELRREVGIDWRTPGGTSDIVRYFDAQYATNFGREHPEFDARQRRGFNDPKAADADPARAAFLAGSTGIGIDLFFGGGEFPHREQAAKGYLVDAGLLDAEPGWFDPAVIPAELSGERMYDPKGRYYGACLSSFGLAVNLARFTGGPAPTWRSLADPALLGAVVIADPTRSGAINTAFERVLQAELAAAAADPDHPTPAELERGWAAGWEVLRRATANAMWVSDGASRAVRAVARGDAVLGMCIDFHARAEAEWSQAAAGAPRLAFVVPRAGTSVAADPISLLRGAPNRELAVAFIRFVLSPDGQRLWNYRPGEPGGPGRYAIRRLPIRRDLYTGEDRRHMSDPDADPYRDATAFTYRPALTARLYRLIPAMAKASLLDPRPELVAAWTAIVRAGGPTAVPEATAMLAHLPVAYADTAAALQELSGPPLARLALLQRWAEAARARYREAQRLAEAGR